jgi:dihydropteroate synthase
MEATALLEGIGVDPAGIRAMLPKMEHLNLRIEGVPAKVANIIKQEMLSRGGDAAVARETVGCTIPETDVLIMGTRKQLTRLMNKLSGQPFGLREMAASMGVILDNIARETLVLKTPRRFIPLSGRTLVMGILNVTPDSFSDGGRFFDPERAVEQGVRMAAEGADIIDIGGESSRPGADPVSAEEESRRVIPVLERLAELVDVPLSVDTTKAAVARAAIAAGAEIVNDISAMQFDPAMPGLIAESGAAVVLMHMRGQPKNMQQGDLSYRDVVTDILEFLRERMAAAKNAGIALEQIAVDPGIGFGKSVEDNLRILKRLREFKVLGRPVLMGVSRKSFIGRITADEGPERLEGTAAAVTAAILGGAAIVRVHDVMAMKKATALSDAIRGA